MRERNTSWRWMVTFLGLLLAFSATACNGGPTEPSLDDLIGIYTGRWRGSITGLEVVLDVRAALAQGAGGGFRLSGSATALNPATGESHPLTIEGSAWLRDAEFSLMSERGEPGLAPTGRFDGELSRDGRTWSGRFTSPTAAPSVPIFGPGEHSVTLTKE